MGMCSCADYTRGYGCRCGSNRRYPIHSRREAMNVVSPSDKVICGYTQAAAAGLVSYLMSQLFLLKNETARLTVLSYLTEYRPF